MKPSLSRYLTRPYALSRRDFLRLSGASLAGAALLGVPLRAQPAEGPVTIVFSFGPDDSGSLQNLIDAFNREFEGQIEVLWREMARESDAYFRQLQSDFLVDAANVDVIGGDIIWTAEFAHNRWIVDLTNRFFNDYDPALFLQAALNSTGYLNRVWAVPWFTDAGMLYYRRDLLEESGFQSPPGTWNELKEMAAQVMQDAGTRYGFVFQGAEYEGGVANALEYIWNAGGRVLTGNITVYGSPGQNLIEPNVITVDSADSALGLDLARSMVADGVAPVEVASFREQEAWQAFLAGDAVFMRNWPFVYGILADPAQSGLTPEQVGVAPLPVASPGQRSFSTLGGWNLMINARSDRQKQEAAWTFIRFATDPARQKLRALEGGFLPTLRSLYEDPEILEAVPVVALGRDAIADTRVRPISPFYSQMSPRIATAFNRVLRGQLTGQEAVRNLQVELQTILRRNR